MHPRRGGSYCGIFVKASEIDTVVGTLNGRSETDLTNMRRCSYIGLYAGTTFFMSSSRLLSLFKLKEKGTIGLCRGPEG